MSEDLHNLFFYANACHVCKSSGNETLLKRCSNCKMISYCGKDHQKQHWLQHKNLCRALSEVLDETDSSNLLQDKKNTNNEEWVKAKMNLMLIVSLKLQRKLLPYEEEMFKFPRACVVCHNTNSKQLIDCQSCPSASFCLEHQNNRNTHKKVCSLLNLCFELDIASTVFLRSAPRNVVPYHTEKAYLPSNIQHFIDLYINEDKSLPVSKEIRNSYISEYLTRPLTLLYAMEKLDHIPDSVLTVHVVGANTIELDSIATWETLLHWLPPLTELNLMLVGPEFGGGNSKRLEPKVCDCCKEKGMKFYVQTHSFLYKDFTAKSFFSKPDIVIGYNLGIHECENFPSEEDSWPDSLRVLQQLKCPFIITSYVENEAKREHERLKLILNKTVNYFSFEKNPYSSFRPHRDYETGGVYYQNQYLIIYKDL